MRPIRLLATVCAAAVLGAACGTDLTSSDPAASPSATPSPTPTGNGVAELPADEILAKAKAALQGAESVRIKGSGGKGTERFDLDMRYSGANSAGSIAVTGQKVDLRKIGQTVYLKGSREFWTGIGGAPAAELLGGKWLKTPLTDKRFADLADVTDLSKAADGILEPDGKVTKGGKKTINGTEAIGLKSAGDDGMLYIATTGEPYPLQITAGSGDTGGVAFTEYGKPVKVAAPPAELVIDVTKLPGA